MGRIVTLLRSSIIALAVVATIPAWGKDPQIPFHPELDKLDARDQIVALMFKEQPLNKVFEAIGQASGLTVRPGEDFHPELPVTVALQKETLREVLIWLASRYQLDYEVPDGKTLVVNSTAGVFRRMVMRGWVVPGRSGEVPPRYLVAHVEVASEPECDDSAEKTCTTQVRVLETFSSKLPDGQQPPREFRLLAGERSKGEPSPIGNRFIVTVVPMEGHPGVWAARFMSRASQSDLDVLREAGAKEITTP